MAVRIYVLHLYCGDGEKRQSLLREAAECVDPVRRNRAAGLKGTNAKAACLGAGMLLQKMVLDLRDGMADNDMVSIEEEELIRMLREHMQRENTQPLELAYRYGDSGKPAIVDFPEHFNLSHSGEYVVCAVSNGEVGIDIQKWVPYKERTAERFFASEECDLLRELPVKQRMEMFYRLWTRKEAYGKYTGLGIGSAVGENLSDEEECRKRQIRFRELTPAEGYSMAVCVKKVCEHTKK